MSERLLRMARALFHKIVHAHVTSNLSHRICHIRVNGVMRKVILSLTFVAAATFSVEAQQSVLAHDGALFTVDTVVEAETGSVVVLRIQHEGEIVEEVVPGSNGGSHRADPAVAYDPGSGSVFVFWLRQLGTMSSQLTFACRDIDGVWSETKEFGDPFIYREHLRIAVTSRISNSDGSLAPEGAINVHLAWWEFDSHTGKEAARYAMLPIENGAVADAIEVDLSSFVEEGDSFVSDDTSLEILKQSLLHTSPTRDSVLVTFGDLATQSFHQVRFKPTKIISDVRIRIPVGRAEGAIGAPRFPVAADSRVEGVQGETGLALYVSGRDKLRYVTLHQGEWSEVRTIVLDSMTSTEMVLGAIRRLVSEQ